MALGTTEIWLIVGAFVLLFGSAALIKWVKAAKQAKVEWEKPVKYEEPTKV